MFGWVKKFLFDADYFTSVMGGAGNRLPSWQALQRYLIAAGFFLVNQGVIPIPVASDTKAGWWITALGAIGALLKSSGEPNMSLEQIAERLKTAQGVKLEAVAPPPPKP